MVEYMFRCFFLCFLSDPDSKFSFNNILLS
uniref:Uncharacterized protein n=1 Tax=Anguilla anguilla TaxID=7936 RepID=A0A0E9XDH9_ANGAN